MEQPFQTRMSPVTPWNRTVTRCRALVESTISRLVLLLPLVVVGTDLLARFWRPAEPVAAMVWFVSLGVVFFAALSLYLSPKTPHSLISLLVPASFIGLSIALANIPLFLNAESTQQINCALTRLGEQDFGFFTPCFLGYPTRTYYLPLLPSLILGRSSLALNIGQHLPVYAGVLLFTAALRRTVPGWKGGIFTGFTLALAFGGYYTAKLFADFEQSLLPFSLALQFAGFAIMYLFVSKGNLLWIALASLVAIHAAYSYTPALALSGFAAALLGLLTFEKRSLYLAILALGTGASMINSATARADHSISGNGVAVSQSVHDSNWTTSQLLFMTDNRLCDPLVLLCCVILLGVASRVWIRYRKESGACQFSRTFVPFLVLLLGWSASVVAASIIFHGYAAPPPDLAIHRATVMFPVLAAFCSCLAYGHSRPSGLAAAIMGIVAVYLGLSTFWRFEQAIRFRQDATNHSALLETIDEARRLGWFDHETRRLIIEGDLMPIIGVINDCNEYLQTLDSIEWLHFGANPDISTRPFLRLSLPGASKIPLARQSTCMYLYRFRGSVLELCENK